MKTGSTEIQQTDRPRNNMPPDELNLFDHIRVLLKYRRMICLVCFVAALVVGLVSFLSPPTYVAVASVVPPMETTRGNSGLGLGLLGGGGAALLRDVMDVSSVADMYVGILQSRVATDAIIDRFDLMQVYGFGSLRDRTRRRLLASTGLNVAEDGILYISVEDRDPQRAAAITNAYVEELDRLNKELSVGQTTSKRIFLESRLRDMEANLVRQDIPAREKHVQEMLYELLMRELEIAKIEEAKSMPTIQVLDSAMPPEQRKPRGTVIKAMLSAIVAFVCMALVAFGREYARECRVGEVTAPLSASSPTSSTDGTVAREDRGRPVTAVPSKRVQIDDREAEPADSGQPA